MENQIEAAKKSVDAALDLWEAPAVSADFDRRLHRRIEQDRPWWHFLLRPQRFVPAAVAAALLIGAGLWIERPGARPEPVPHTAAVEALPPDQAESALQEMELMQEFNRLVRTDAAGEPKM